MYQIQSRVGSVRLNPEELEPVNKLMTAYQQKVNIEFGTFRDLFLHLLRQSITAPAEDNVNVPKTNANTVVLAENDTVINLHPEFKQAIEQYRDVSGLPGEEPVNGLLFLAVQAAANGLEDFTREPEIREVEVVKEVERPLTENDVLFTLSLEQRETLEYIITARAKDRPDYPQYSTLPALCRAMIFNNGTLRNYGGEFYTGIR